MAKKLQILLGIGGLALLFWMIQRVGFSVLKENLLHFGLGPALFLIALYTLAQIAFALAWYVVLDDPEKKLSFWDIFVAYAAGDALNMTIPSGNLAGEPVKVMLVKDKFPIESAVTSVTVYKFADYISLTLFLACGWAFQFFFYSLPLPWNVGAGLITFGMTVAAFIFFWIQKKGLYLPAGRWLGRLGLQKWIEGKLHSAHLVDEGVRDFYAHRPQKFGASVFFNFLAWFGGVLEIMIFMSFLGLKASFPAALTVETFSLFLNNITFFVPARLGVGEGGRTLIFMALGFTKEVGLTYGIIRRIRELAWVGLGYLVLSLRRK